MQLVQLQGSAWGLAATTCGLLNAAKPLGAPADAMLLLDSQARLTALQYCHLFMVGEQIKVRQQGAGR